MLLHQRDEVDGDERVYYDGFELIMPKKNESDLNDIDKRFKASKKRLQEIYTEADSFGRDLKRRIKDVKTTTAYGRNQAETELRLYETYQRSITDKLSIQKAIIDVEVKCIDLKLKSDKNMIDSGKPVAEAMSNKVLGMSLLNGQAHQGVGFHEFGNIINPNNARTQPQVENVQPMYSLEGQIQQPTQQLNQPQHIPYGDDGDEDVSGLLVDRDRNTDFGYALKNLELRNQQNKDGVVLKEVIHYDRGNGLFWIDTVDETTGAPIDARKKHIAMIKDGLDIDLKNMSARDEYGSKYTVVLDNSENMPEEVKDQWREFSDLVE